MFQCIVQPRREWAWGSLDEDNALADIRMQLCEHTRVLESRAEAAAGVASELHEYCRRRGELEHEYARALDKLARGAQQRHRDARHRREQWPLCGAHRCWQAALEHARALARDHAALADLYAGPLAARSQRAAEDVLRLHRKCRDLVLERHDELAAALADAAAAGKAHAAAAADWRAQAHKLRRAHDARQAHLDAAQEPHNGGNTSKKLKALDKELEKRRNRHTEARGRALRARADYVLSLEAANATLQRYFLDDVVDIMLCGEVGFEAVVGRVTRTAGAAEAGVGGARVTAGAALAAAGSALDAAADAQRTLDAHASAFRPPRPLPFRGATPDALDAEVAHTLGAAAAAALPDEAAERAAADLAQRVQQLDAAAAHLRLECQENAKTLDAAEAELIKQMEGSEEQWDVSGLFGRSEPAPPPAPPDPAADAPRRTQEDYYLTKFRSYVSCAGRLARLESKAAAARARLGAPAAAGVGAGVGAGAPRRAGARLRRGRFAAPLDERLAESAAVPLPVVLVSCVRVIARHGARHQGVFRVSGSQVEMQALRAAYERGEDPLARGRGRERAAADVNTVCGLLKLWLRELRPPLLPPRLRARLLEVAAAPDAQFVSRMAREMRALPPPALLVLRYLFAFLAHLAGHSARTMMDAWNLAICVGPTLLAAWDEGGGQVAAQNVLNELVKRTIVHHQEIFPQDIAPHTLFMPPRDDEEEDDEGGAGGEGEEAEGRAEGGADEHDAPDELSLLDDDEDTSEEGDAGEERGEQGEHGAALDREGITPQDDVQDTEERAAACRRLESTPDLVLDLPARAAATVPHAPPQTAAPLAPLVPPEPTVPQSVPDVELADSADTFLHNRDTLKKRPTPKSSVLPDASGAGGAEEVGLVGVTGAVAARGERDDGREGGEVRHEGSPVPARNTARVAAKFAELTLTGGSLKPLPPARPARSDRPALLRRPTPHPHRVAPQTQTHMHTETDLP